MTIKKSMAFKGWLICLLGAVFYWYEYLLRIEPSVVVTELMQQLNVTASGFGLITAFYYYSYTPMQLAVGVLLDRYGTKLILSMCICFCVLGSFFFSIASSVFVASAARFLIGFGSAFAFVGVMKLGAEWLPKQHFAFLAGLATSLGMLGGMTGDIILAAFLNDFGLAKVLHLGTLIGIILIPFIFIFIKDTPHPKNPNPELNISLGKTLSGLKAIIKNPHMWICGLIANTLYLSLTAFAELWGIKFLQTVYNLEAQKASLACSAVFFGWLVCGPFNGWLSDRINSRKIPLLFGGILGAATITLIILKPFTISFSLLCVFLFLFGSFCSTQILCFAISKENNHHHLAATSIAFTNFLVMIGGMVFQPLIGFLLDFVWSGSMINNIRVYSTANYQLVFLTIPLCILIGSFLTTKLPETLKK
ncbi:MAG: MFS transporter [Chlamydiota bacterium]